MQPLAKQINGLYRRLHAAYGPQDWWPAETPFEVMAGAILTQNTAWTNVEQAIANLKRADALSAPAILDLSHARLAELIRPSGYFNIKSRRLKNYAQWFIDEGGLARLSQLELDDLRARLLSVNGVGPETADDILLYAFERPAFVIDTYTRRLLLKLGLIEGGESYDALRQLFMQSLKPEVAHFKQYHALIVRHAKQKCAGREDCPHCRVERL